MKLKALILMSLLSTSAFAFEPPADQDCVEVQRECQPDANRLRCRAGREESALSLGTL